MGRARILEAQISVNPDGKCTLELGFPGETYHSKINRPISRSHFLGIFFHTALFWFQMSSVLICTLEDGCMCVYACVHVCACVYMFIECICIGIHVCVCMCVLYLSQQPSGLLFPPVGARTLRVKQSYYKALQLTCSSCICFHL